MIEYTSGILRLNHKIDRSFRRSRAALQPGLAMCQPSGPIVDRYMHGNPDQP